jgi:hypothetical protein
MKALRRPTHASERSGLGTRYDNLPQGTSDYDVYRMNVVADSAVSSLLAQRIEQGIGRGTRGGADYCAVMLIGSKLVGWIIPR